MDGGCYPMATDELPWGMDGSNWRASGGGAASMPGGCTWGGAMAEVVRRGGLVGQVGWGVGRSGKLVEVRLSGEMCRGEKDWHVYCEGTNSTTRRVATLEDSTKCTTSGAGLLWQGVVGKLVSRSASTHQVTIHASFNLGGAPNILHCAQRKPSIVA